MRGVSPLIRGQIRNASQEHGGIFLTAEQQHMESKSSFLINNSGEVSHRSLAGITISKPGGDGSQKLQMHSSNVRAQQEALAREKIAQNQVEISPHAQSIKDIIAKVRKMQGGNPINSKLQSMGELVNKQMLAQKIRN